jgi:hypothetical protein
MRNVVIRTLGISITLFAVTAHQAFAQPPADVQPAVKCNRLVTNGWVDATSAQILGQRIFGYDFQEDPDDLYFIADPGFNTAGASALPPGLPLGFNVLSGADFELSGNLTYWNGIGAVQFGLLPSGESIALSFSSSSVSIGGSLGEQPGFTIQTPGATGAVHRHLSSVISGTGIPANGIYLMALELTVPGLEDSLPFFFVYKNGVAESAQNLAIDWVKSNLIYPLGDFNLDHSVSTADIPAMLDALTDLSTFQATHQLSNAELLGLGDMDGDCKITNTDLQPLLDLVAGEEPHVVPEPSALILAAFASLAGLQRSCSRWKLLRRSHCNSGERPELET